MLFCNYEKLARKLIEEAKKDDEFMKKVVRHMAMDVDKELMVEFKEMCKEALIKIEKVRVLESLSNIDYIAEIKADIAKDIKKKIDDTVNEIFEV